MNHERRLVQTLRSQQIILISWPNTVRWLETVGGGHAWFPVRSIHTFLLFFFLLLHRHRLLPWSPPSSSTSRLQKPLLLPVFAACDIMYTNIEWSHSWVSAAAGAGAAAVCVYMRYNMWNSSGQGLNRGPLTLQLHTHKRNNNNIIPVR